MNRDLITQKLEQIEDLNQRKALKKIMINFFDELIKYQNQINSKVESRIFEEFKEIRKNYDIYATMVKRDSVDPIHEYLFPIFKEDVEENTYDFEEIKEAMFNKKDVNISTVYLEMDALEIESLISQEREFSGSIKTDEGNFDMSLKLEVKKKYREIPEIFNKYFKSNTVVWRTINFPFLRKFFDIIITNYDEGLEKYRDDIKNMPNIEEISFDLEDLEDNKHINLVPVWNIDYAEEKSDGFPLPAEDKINFEHSISMKKLNKEYGYLVTSDDAEIFGINRTDNELIITSNKNRSSIWGIIKIVQNSFLKKYKGEYPIINNSKRENFLNKFMEGQKAVIRTSAEINRVVNSFEVSRNFVFKDVQILENHQEDYHTVDLNFFIKDEIREIIDKKTMLLSFSAKNFTYLTYDNLSFIVSEIQNYFPEYICKGVIK